MTNFSKVDFHCLVSKNQDEEMTAEMTILHIFFELIHIIMK